MANSAVYQLSSQNCKSKVRRYISCPTPAMSDTPARNRRSVNRATSPPAKSPAPPRDSSPPAKVAAKKPKTPSKKVDAQPAPEQSPQASAGKQFSADTNYLAALYWMSFTAGFYFFVAPNLASHQSSELGAQNCFNVAKWIILAVGCLNAIRFLALPNLEKAAHIARECFYPIATPLLVAGWSHAIISPQLKFLEAITILEAQHRVALVVILSIVIAHTVSHGNKFVKHATNLFIYGFLAFHIYNKHATAMNTLAFVGLVADMAYNQFVIKDLENELGHGAGGPWFLSLSFIVFFGVSKAFL